MPRNEPCQCRHCQKVRPAILAQTQGSPGLAERRALNKVTNPKRRTRRLKRRNAGGAPKGWDAV